MLFVFIPALLSPLVFLIPRGGKAPFALALIVAGAAAALTLALGALTGGEPRQWELPGLFGTQRLVVDALSGVFMVIICAGAVAAALYSIGYIAAQERKPAAHLSLHCMCLPLLFFSMLGVVVSRGGYAFLFSWEMMSVSSFALILFEGRNPRTRRAAMSYLVMMHVGFVFLLAAFAALGSRGLPMDFDSLGRYFSGGGAPALMALFMVGFGMKAGLFPLHSWLPEAHPAAPAHVSAFMSGAMIKMGVYGIMRVISHMPADAVWAGVALFCAGLVTSVWGVLCAAVQSDMKRLMAWSTIENAGLIVMAVGLARIGMAEGQTTLAMCAMGGAILHSFNHSMFKALLFFGAGNVYTATHTTSLDELGGVARRMPVTAALTLVGVAAICALPPLSGFVSELMIYYGLFDAISTGGRAAAVSLAGLLALAFTGGVVILAFTKLYGMTFLGNPRSKAVEGAREVDGVRIAAAAIPLSGILLVWLAPGTVARTVALVAGSVTGIPPGAALPAGADIASPALAGGIFVGATLLILLLKRRAMRGRERASSPTWGCGYGTPTARMQYTGESFSEGLQSVVPQLSGSTAPGCAPQPDEIFPRRRRFSVRRSDSVGALMEAWWVELLRQINRRVMAMRTGKVNYHILYALSFLLAILLLSIFSII